MKTTRDEPLLEVELTLLFDGKPWKTRYLNNQTQAQVEAWKTELRRIDQEYTMVVREVKE